MRPPDDNDGFFSLPHGDSDVDAEVDVDDQDMLDVEEGGAPLHHATDTTISTMSQVQEHQEHQDPLDIDHFPLPPPPPIVVPVPPLPPPPIELPDDIPADTDDDVVVEVEAFEFAVGPHPVFVTNPNPGILLPENPNLHDFLRYWQWLKTQGWLSDIRQSPVNENSVIEDAANRTRIEYDDLLPEECDIQGTDWVKMGVDRLTARRCRVKTFRNYVNLRQSDVWNKSLPDVLLDNGENYYRFQSMDIRHDVRLLHFQLRNILACHNRNRVFYPAGHAVRDTVRELDPTTGNVKTAMKFKSGRDAAVSTLTADESILMSGSFYGTYQYRSLHGDGVCADGRLTEHPSGITNHVQISSSHTSSAPQAAFASNDRGFRIVDLPTNQIISRTMFPYAINSSALSPDKRLRVMVGDLQEVLITEADTGKIAASIKGHRDYGFACDWSPDGTKVATGNQDKTVRVWDSRKWKEPVAVLRCEMAGARSIRFSPLGTRPVLVAAEEADFVNIIDGVSFDSKQTFDIFGELAGVAFTSEGEEIVVMSSDPYRGGIMTLERSRNEIWAESPTRRQMKEPALDEDWFY
ncbi:WD40-repeat-containing domain protein [Xylariaceae sp. FL0255]|nr:WD40-repeat-containing domain protein [Xylariaceae sp. FL0255]